MSVVLEDLQRSLYDLDIPLQHSYGLSVTNIEGRINDKKEKELKQCLK